MIDSIVEDLKLYRDRFHRVASTVDIMIDELERFRCGHRRPKKPYATDEGADHVVACGRCGACWVWGEP